MFARLFVLYFVNIDWWKYDPQIIQYWILSYQPKLPTLKINEWASKTVEVQCMCLLLLYVWGLKMTDGLQWCDPVWSCLPVVRHPDSHLHLPELPFSQHFGSLELWSQTKCDFSPFPRAPCHGRRCVFFAGKAVAIVFVCVTSVFSPSSLWHQVQSYSVLLYFWKSKMPIRVHDVE